MKLFLDTIHRDQWQRYLKRYPIHVYKKGEIVLMEGEAPTCVRIINAGLVKTYNINKHGEERPVSFDGKPEMFPIGWVVDAIEKAEYFYEAFTDCEIYEIPKKDLLLYFKLHPRMGCELFLTLGRRFVSLQAKIYALEQSRAADKIILTLLHLGERFATPNKHNNNLQLIHLPLTQQEIANFIGITRETTSTELKKLERKHVIKHKHKEYEINIIKLKNLLEE